MSYIKEYLNVIPEQLCDEIINKFNQRRFSSLPVTDLNSMTDKLVEDIFIIPKNDTEWNRIEQFLYKALLLKINNYKKVLLTNLLNMKDPDILVLLNKNMFLDNFKIIKISNNNPDIIFNNYMKNNNRYNILTFIFYLNDVENGGKVMVTDDSVQFLDDKNNYSDTCNIVPEKKKLLLLSEIIPNTYKFMSPISNIQYIITGQICENMINL